MIPAYEVLIVTSSVSNLIRTNKITQINNAITTSKAMGMVLMDNFLEALAINDLISTEEACDRATNPTNMLQIINQLKLAKERRMS